MQSKNDSTGRYGWHSVLMLAGLTLNLFLIPPGAGAQTNDAKAVDTRGVPERYQTLQLTNISQPNDANDLVTDLRNMLPNARVSYLPTQGVVSMRATPEDFALAQKIIADLDRPKKSYRLTYTITETDGGKPLSKQRFNLVLVSGARATLKQGGRLPIVTGVVDTAGSTPGTQVQYIDLGLNIEANLDGFLEGLRLRTKIEQSSPAEEKSGVSAQDPIIRQTLLEATTTLVQGKPVVLGSLDVPDSTHHKEIEVLSELVK